MVLIINCIPKLEDREWFTRAVVPRLEEIAGRPIHVENLDQLEGFVPDQECSHVVISGSELSAAHSNPTDDALIALIRRSVNQNRVVLGICYGHQMVARALVDDNACRRAAIPEYGFKKVSLVPNHLFSGIDTLTQVHAHNDEVTGLPIRGAGKLGARLEEHRGAAFLSRELATIATDMPLSIAEDLTPGPPDIDGLDALFDRLGFGEALRRQVRRIAP